jgi:hypothetical protein
MAIVTYRVCDRCKKPIDDHSRRLSKVRKAKVRSAFLGIVDEREFELCGKCSDELDKWLYPIKEKEDA